MYYITLRDTIYQSRRNFYCSSCQEILLCIGDLSKRVIYVQQVFSIQQDCTLVELSWFSLSTYFVVCLFVCQFGHLHICNVPRAKRFSYALGFYLCPAGFLDTTSLHPSRIFLVCLYIFICLFVWKPSQKDESDLSKLVIYVQQVFLIQQNQDQTALWSDRFFSLFFFILVCLLDAFIEGRMIIPMGLKSSLRE